MKKSSLIPLFTILTATLLSFGCGIKNENKDPDIDIHEEIPDHSFKVENLFLFKGFKAETPIVTFNNEKYTTDEVTYTIEVSKGVHSKFNKETKTFSYLNDGITFVKASTEYYETMFKIVTATHEFNDGIDNALKNLNANAETQEGGTIFFGDSFFDNRWFWTNFYSSYANQNINTVGIGSTTIEDWNKNVSGNKTGKLAERLVLPYKPSQIIVHLGSNDIYDDRGAPEYVLENVKSLFTFITNALPQTKIFYLGTEVRVDVKTGLPYNENNVYTTNDYVENYLKNIDNATFVETKSLYLNENGDVDASFFKDGIHPKLEKYKDYNNKLIECGAILPKL